MQAAKTITPPEWMTSPESRAVFTALQDPSAAPQVLFVGGCVRNALLGIPAGDCDLATVHSPQETTRRLEQAGIKVVPTGIDYGTVTAAVNAIPFEITTLRRDVETDGRRAVVAYTGDWAEDAARRDFTMNTLLADNQGKIFDPIRTGIHDLEAKKIVFVGDPAMRIAEDYLRILRFFRFHALYAEGAPDPAALAACADAAERIAKLSRERITQEFLKIIVAPKAGVILDVMLKNRVLSDLPHPDFDIGSFMALSGLQNRLSMVSVESRLVHLCAGQAGHLEKVEKYLLFSNEQKRTLYEIFDALRSPYNLQERLYRFGRDIGSQSVLTLAAMTGAKLGPDDIETMREWPIPAFPITGEDIRALGVPQGPRIGEVLEEVETWWMEWSFQPGREQCLERAKMRVFGSAEPV